MKKRKIILRPRAKLIRKLASQYNITTFVETGTHMGYMVDAVSQSFNFIYTIELNSSFYEQAIAKFSREPKIHMLFGDSAEILPLIIPSIQHPCIYWLDAHFSGEGTAYGSKRTPICKEIEAILQAGDEKDIVIIDNIECFKNESREREDYPLITDIEKMLKEKFSKWTVKVENQILTAYKK